MAPVKLSWLYFTISAVSAALPASDRIAPYQCPNPLPPTVSTFDVPRYLGNWYVQYTIPQVYQPSGTRCIRAQYGDTGNGIISVYNSGTRSNGMFDEICGRAFQVDATNTPGHLNVEFPFNLSPGNYRVLGTDYDNYVVVWSCTSGGIFGGGELGWVMTRNPNPSQATLNQALSVLTSNGLSTSAYERVTHDASCEYDTNKLSCKGERFPDDPVERVLNVIKYLNRFLFRIITSG